MAQRESKYYNIFYSIIYDSVDRVVRRERCARGFLRDLEIFCFLHFTHGSPSLIRINILTDQKTLWNVEEVGVEFFTTFSSLLCWHDLLKGASDKKEEQAEAEEWLLSLSLSFSLACLCTFMGWKAIYLIYSDFISPIKIHPDEMIYNLRELDQFTSPCLLLKQNSSKSSLIFLLIVHHEVSLIF